MCLQRRTIDHIQHTVCCGDFSLIVLPLLSLGYTMNNNEMLVIGFGQELGHGALVHPVLATYDRGVVLSCLLIG
jgi:hypothetical protein